MTEISYKQLKVQEAVANILMSIEGTKVLRNELIDTPSRVFNACIKR